jgi:starch phosphorylase
LKRLLELAFNLRWSWDHDAINLFRRLEIANSGKRSTATRLKLLGTIAQDKLAQAAGDEAFMAHLDRVCQDFDQYMNARKHLFRKNHGDFDKPYIAYFSAEFGPDRMLAQLLRRSGSPQR